MPLLSKYSKLTKKQWKDKITYITRYWPSFKPILFAEIKKENVSEFYFKIRKNMKENKVFYVRPLEKK